jgi:predicted RNA-binding Zn ribbon-like protein
VSGESGDGKPIFRFLGGRPCLDLTATVGERRGRQAERLRTAQDLAIWLVAARLADDWAGRPPPRTWLEADDSQLRTRRDPTTVAALLASLACDAVDLLGGPLAGRIRECAAGDCALLFLDTSRAGRRRWCSMATCGARAKMAAYRARRPSTTP